MLILPFEQGFLQCSQHLSTLLVGLTQPLVLPPGQIILAKSYEQVMQSLLELPKRTIYPLQVEIFMCLLFQPSAKLAAMELEDLLICDPNS